MTTISQSTFAINGVLSTDKTVYENLETLCSASGAWWTFDTTTGKWSVIINRTGSSIASFDDNNIQGSISVNGTGITELYNKVKVEFPHKDLLDERDYITIEIPAEDRYANEFDNTLEIQYDCLNDPVQAEILGLVELKQSRVDKVIQFRTDFSKLGLRAGDLIDVTSEMYGFYGKLFRIVSLSEEDGDDGNIVISITALEYDPNVYDYSTVYRYLRERKTDIPNKYGNDVLNTLDDIGLSNQLDRAMNNTANLALANLIASLLKALTGSGGWAGSLIGAGSPLVVAAIDDVGPAFTGNNMIVTYTPGPITKGTLQKYDEFAFTCPATGRYKIRMNVMFGATAGALVDPTVKVVGVYLYSGGYYNGDLGNSSTQLIDTFQNEIITGQTAGGVINSQYQGNQYTDMYLEGFCDLTAGVNYYCNSFICTTSAVTSLSAKTIEVSAAMVLA